MESIDPVRGVGRFFLLGVRPVAAPQDAGGVRGHQRANELLQLFVAAVDAWQSIGRRQLDPAAPAFKQGDQLAWRTARVSAAKLIDDQWNRHALRQSQQSRAAVRAQVHLQIHVPAQSFNPVADFNRVLN